MMQTGDPIAKGQQIKDLRPVVGGLCRVRDLIRDNDGQS